MTRKLLHKLRLKPSGGLGESWRICFKARCNVQPEGHQALSQDGRNQYIVSQPLRRLWEGGPLEGLWEGDPLRGTEGLGVPQADGEL